MNTASKGSTRSCSERGTRSRPLSERKGGPVGLFFLPLSVFFMILLVLGTESAPLNRQHAGEGLLSIHRPLSSSGSSSVPANVNRLDTDANKEDLPRISVGEHVPETTLKAPRSCPDFTQFVVSLDVKKFTSRTLDGRLIYVLAFLSL